MRPIVNSFHPTIKSYRWNRWQYYKYSMRWNEINEGKVYQMGQRYGVSGEEVPVFSNPTTQQVVTLITRSMEGMVQSTFNPHLFYLRGICFEDKKMLLWNGYKLTHDDAFHEFFPKAESHHSEYTTFEADERGIEIVRPGDYDVRQTRWYAAIMAAITQCVPINEAKMPLSSHTMAFYDQIPESGNIKINLDGSVLSTLRALKDAGMIDMTINSASFQAIVSRKAQKPKPVAKPGVSIDQLPAATKQDILDMLIGPNGPPAFEQYWEAERGIMSFNDTYVSQFLFGEENLAAIGTGDGIKVNLFTLNPSVLDNSQRSVSDLVVGQYAALRTKAPPILVRREGKGWKLVEGGHRLAAAKQRGDKTIQAVDVSVFYTISEEQWNEL